MYYKNSFTTFILVAFSKLLLSAISWKPKVMCGIFISHQKHIKFIWIKNEIRLEETKSDLADWFDNEERCQ